MEFDETKITDAIFEAAKSVGGADRQLAMELTLNVLKALKNENKQTVDVEHIQDIVEKVLIESGHARTAKSYILYRARRTGMRSSRSELMDTVAEILKETDRDLSLIHISTLPKLEEYLFKIAEPGDLIMTVGAGDIFKVGEELVTELERGR